MDCHPSRPHFWARLPATRFSSIPARLAGLVLVGLAALVVYGVILPTSKSGHGATAVSARAGGNDLELYKAINRRMVAGESYYPAATGEHRARGYPLHPFVTVRLPTMATVHAALGTIGARVLLWGLTLAAWIQLAVRLRADLGAGRHALYAAALAVIGLAPILTPPCLYWHEPWAAALTTLSIGCRSRSHWGASVLFGLAAVAFRELALPYLVVMAVTALYDGQRREAAAWLAAILTSAAFLAIHALLVSHFVTAADLRSPGWAGFGGWAFVLQMLRNFTSLAILPAAVVAFVVPLSLLGWVGLRAPIGLRGALLLCGYATGFLLLGRSENDYWGMLLAPLLPVGLVFAPAALRDLVARVGAGLPSGLWFRAAV